MRARWFGHVDMDAFYAAVEVLDSPELAGLPVAVGGPVSARGVIAAASYPARAFGVRSAMPTGEALRLCPQLVLRPARGRRYLQKSREIMAILRSVSPSVEPLSLDEAFLDLTGCERLHAEADGWTAFGARLQERIHQQTGLWASVGMGETRRIAKIASDLRKPHGLVVVDPGRGAEFLQGLPVERLWGVGPKLRERLLSLGMRTGADIAHTPRPALQMALGATGLALHDLVHALETGEVVADRENHSISHEETFVRDRVGMDALLPTLLHQCDKVGARLREHGVLGRVVHIKVRNADFHTVTRRQTLRRATDSEATIYHVATRLLHQLGWGNVPVRLVGVGVGDLTPNTARQGDLFGDRSDRVHERLERALDGVHARFGDEAIGRALSLLRPQGPRWNGATDGAGMARRDAL